MLGLIQPSSPSTKELHGIVAYPTAFYTENYAGLNKPLPPSTKVLKGSGVCNLQLGKLNK